MTTAKMNDQRVSVSRRTTIMTAEEADSISRYFQQISEFPVLSLEETVRLFKRYERARSRKARLALRDKIIVHNLRFVISIAKIRFGMKKPKTRPLARIAQCCVAA